MAQVVAILSTTPGVKAERGGRLYTCPHGGQVSRCVDCCGVGLCEHDRREDQCSQCRDYICNVVGCPSEGRRFAGRASLKRHTILKHSNDLYACVRALQLLRPRQNHKKERRPGCLLLTCPAQVSVQGDQSDAG